jgi:hypothetical protein
MGTKMAVSFRLSNDEEREWNLARTAFYQAQHNFDNADPEHIEAAVYQLKAAELRMDNAYRALKKARGELA